VSLDDSFHDGGRASTAYELARFMDFVGTAYKYPKLKIASNESFVRVLTCRFHTTVTGRDANKTSVRILTIELNNPMCVKRALLKHFALGSPARSHDARIGMQEKRIVCNEPAFSFLDQNYKSAKLTPSLESVNATRNATN
jgi:hypothetical protein